MAYNALREALALATPLGMKVLWSHTEGAKREVAHIFCAECGWPETHRDTVIEKYIREPYACGRCAWGREHKAEHEQDR